MGMALPAYQEPKTSSYLNGALGTDSVSVVSYLSDEIGMVSLIKITFF